MATSTLKRQFGRTSGNGTVNSTYCSAGELNWTLQRVGNVSIAFVRYDITFNGSYDADSGTPAVRFGDGLPKPLTSQPAQFIDNQGTSTGYKIVKVYNDGHIGPYWSGTVSGRWMGFVSYPSTD